MRLSARMLPVALCLVLLAPATLRAGQASRAELVNLVYASGALEISTSILDMIPTQIFKGLKAKKPDVPDALLGILSEEFQKERKAFVGDVADISAEIWGQRLTRDEVLELTELYKRPVFKKAVKLSPQIMQESMIRSQSMAKQLIERVMPRIKARMRDELGMTMKD